MTFQREDMSTSFFLQVTVMAAMTATIDCGVCNCPGRSECSAQTCVLSVAIHTTSRDSCQAGQPKEMHKAKGFCSATRLHKRRSSCCPASH